MTRKSLSIPRLAGMALAFRFIPALVENPKRRSSGDCFPMESDHAHATDR
jgi:hypothetical protein